MALSGDPSLPVSKETRDKITQHLWLQRSSTAPDPAQIYWDSYFAYYTAECNLAIQSGGGCYTTIRSHDDIIALASELQAHQSKDEIKQWLRPKLQGPRAQKEADDMLEGSTTLVARLLAMTEIGPRPFMSGVQTALNWTDNTISLKQLMAIRFKDQSATIQSGFEFEEEFTAYNLQRLAGINIIWTDNLADHLRLTHNRKKVHIFHHASFLKWQERRALTNHSTGVANLFAATRAFSHPA